MFKRGHTISYWFTDSGNHTYMDDEGKVYSVKHNVYDNKPTKKVKPMSYFKTKIAIMTVIIIALWTGILMAAEPKQYQAVIAMPNVMPNSITALEVTGAWTNLESLKNTITTFNTVSPAKAAEDYQYYLSIGDFVMFVKEGFVAVRYLESFDGFHLFEITGIIEKS